MIALEDAKAHLRVSHNDEDAEITIKLRLAEALVNDYIGWPVGSHSGFSEDVKDAAVLLVLGELYANREASQSDPLSPAVKTILGRLRAPVMA